ncbi:MAG TPA: CHAT domain-containing protein [Stenomitos sp.]
MKPLHLMLAILPVWGAIATSPCAAQPIVPAADGTGTLVNANSNLINISGGSLNQNQTNLFHSFSQFGLNQNQIANFLSNPSIQNILARVVGGDASIINGLIQVSGGNSNLYLINPAGIIFGAGSSLNVPASFMATTATGVGFGDNWLSAAGGNDYAPLVGNPNTFAFTTGQPGAIANFGNLAVSAGNSITFLGGTVLNAGQLSAVGGQVILTAVSGEKLVRLSQAGTVLSLEVQPLAASSTQPQPWTFPIQSLPQLLTGGGVDSANQVQVNPDGTIQLTGSDISIPSDTGTVIASGTIDVSTSEPPLTLSSQGREPESEPPFLRGAGGIVNVLGDRVGLFNAHINASGINGGGTVLIGGDYQGKGSVPNALRTFVSSDSVIRADALVNDNGGKVIVWADEVTRFYGTTSVRGGNLSGNGGIVEVSSKGSLLFQGTADTTASQGNIGILLLDPTDILIREGIGNGNDLDGSNDGFTGSPFGGVGQVLANDTTPTVLFESEIARLAANSNVVLEATNNITIENLSYDFLGLNPLVSLAPTLKGSLTFRAGNSFSMNQGDTILTQGGISISAANITTGRLIAGQGITLNATSNMATTDLASLTAINLTAGGSISTNRLLAGGDINIPGVSLPVGIGNGNAGSITLSSNGNIVTGGINTSSQNGNAGNVTLSSAAGTILIDPSRGESTLMIDGKPLDATGAVFAVAKESGRGGTIKLQANGNITTGAIASGSLRGDGGEINLISTAGAIDTTQGEIKYRGETIPDTGLLLSGSGGNGTGGKITVTASGDIITGPVVSASREGDGGEINLTSANGKIDTLQGLTSLQAFEALLRGADISSSDLSPQTSSNLFPLARIVAGSIVSGSGGDGTGGKITVSAGGNLSTGGVISTSIDGNGGDINLTSTTNDIDVFLINSQSLGAGRGGNVNVNANRFFRATGTAQTALDQLPPDAVNPSDIPARLDRQASISSAGNSGGGSITIRHGGGDNDIPFLVGNATFNGTVGSITTRSSNTISPKRDFWGSYTQDNIQIITSPQDPINPEFPPIPDSLSLQAPVSQIQLATLEEAREIIRQIQGAIGIRPALIYVSFVPAAIPQNPDVTNQEKIFTQQFERHLATSSVVVDPKISLEPQDSDELELLLVTAQGKPIRKHLTGVTRELVLAVAEQFRTEITLNQSDDYLPPAQKLYQWLIAPLEAELQAQGIENLAFIMDAELRSIPMAALHDGQQFLIERYSVGLMPSLSLTDTRYQSARNAQILAMGASKFSDPKLNPLYAVPEEVQTIVSEWPRKGKYFLNRDFTFENLKGQRAQQPFGIIHLATHAVFQSGTLSNSFIQLGDRRLGLHELRQLGWNNPPVELLVLSACQTVLGDQDAELGFAGLAYQAGVKSALASLWYVDDRATLALMTEFYRQLGKVSTKAEALRQAQLALLRGQLRVEAGELRTARGTMPLPPELGKRGQVNFSNPASWAAFTLVGSPW